MQIETVVRVDRIRHVQDVIANTPYCALGAPAIEFTARRFNMGSFFSSCGTPGCIAGWTMQLYADLLPDHTFAQFITNLFGRKDMDVAGNAAAILGLDRTWARMNLFVPSQFALDKLTNFDAIKALDIIVANANMYQKLNQLHLWKPDDNPFNCN